MIANKTKVRNLLDKHTYTFEDITNVRSTSFVEHHLIQFVYLQPRPAGIYKNELILKVIRALWFTPLHGEGREHPAAFNPMPAPAIALACTGVRPYCARCGITNLRFSCRFILF